MNASSAPDLHRACPADAERLVELARETFIDTFGHLYPAEDLQAFLADAHTSQRYQAWMDDPAYAVWIAEQDGRALGYALTGPCHLPHPEVTADCGELWRLYVRRETQGTGLGGQLLDAALQGLAQPGRRLWLGVWSENHRAQKIYAGRGFTKVGEYEFPVGRTRDREFILSNQPAAADLSSDREPPPSRRS